ncbi:MAG: YtxH domain-containing protein [Chloroflexi bacterium]|jgi:gas vesicle protein|nr:YtxH domain-containing protein [Chloroflexota bacterium]
MSDSDSGSRFAIGFTLGIAIGLALGFLFTPRSGKETRGLVKDKAADVSETVKDLTADRRKVYTETWKKRRGQPKVSESYFES